MLLHTPVVSALKSSCIESHRTRGIKPHAVAGRGFWASQLQSQKGSVIFTKAVIFTGELLLRIVGLGGDRVRDRVRECCGRWALSPQEESFLLFGMFFPQRR